MPPHLPSGPALQDPRYLAVLAERGRREAATARGVSVLTAEDAAGPRTSLRVPELLLGFLLAMEAYTLPAGGVPVPLNEAAMMVLLGLALCRRAKRRASALGVAALLAVLVGVYLAAVSLAMGVPDAVWLRRLVRMAALTALVGCFAARRVDLRSVLTGLLAAMAVNVPLFYAGLVPAPYQGFLTGFLADKNVAGLYYAAVPVLALTFVRRPGVRLLLLSASGLCVFLTGSRTSLAGFACALVWVVLTPRMGPVLRVALLALLAWAVGFAEENLARVGVYSDREGTDWFRSVIHTATGVKVEETPWTGQGLAQSCVELDAGRFLFHNSYAALYVEGGVVLTAAMLTAYAVYGLRLGATRLRTPSRVAVEAAAVVVLVTATQLGEVFVSIPSMLILAAGATLAITEADAPLDAQARARREERTLRQAAARGH